MISTVGMQQLGYQYQQKFKENHNALKSQTFRMLGFHKEGDMLSLNLELRSAASNMSSTLDYQFRTKCLFPLIEPDWKPYHNNYNARNHRRYYDLFNNRFTSKCH